MVRFEEMDKIGDSELFDLKYTFSAYILPRLEAFKAKMDSGELLSYPEFKNRFELGESYKGIQDNEVLWYEIVTDMIFPFDYYCNPDDYKELQSDEIEAKRTRGLNNFALFFDDLWI